MNPFKTSYIVLIIDFMIDIFIIFLRDFPFFVLHIFIFVDIFCFERDSNNKLG